MERKKVQRYISLGGTEKYLEDVEAGWQIHGKPYVLFNIRSFCDMLRELDLPVTAEAARYIRLHEFEKELEETDPGARLTEEQAQWLGTEMRKVRVALFAESFRKLAFVVGEKRFDTDKLLDSPGDLLAPGVFDALEPSIQYDINEAGKCIAFERSTAAAFHLMRATEGMLRCFYCSTVKRERVSPLLWHPMVEHLRSRSKPPPATLLNQLDHIRHNFRNPTQHPDAVYDTQEAQDLFSLAVDAITRLVRAMP